MNFLSRLFADSAIRIHQGSIECVKGKVTHRLLEEISSITTESNISDGEIWINSVGLVSFSKGTPTEIHQRIRNVISAESWEWQRRNFDANLTPIFKIPHVKSQRIQIKDPIQMLLKSFRVILCKRRHLVIAEAAGVKPVGHAAIIPFDSFNQIFRPQFLHPTESPDDDIILTDLDSLIPQHRSKEKHKKNECHT